MRSPGISADANGGDTVTRKRSDVAVAPQWAYLSLGSNMGDRVRCIQTAIAKLQGLAGTSVVARARLYETQPVDFSDQDWFVNTVVKIETRLSPDLLLAALKNIEAAMGRVPNGIRFGPRPLDLDILLMEDTVVRTSRVTIPHPRMQNRRFVLQPICDIDPDLRHPQLHLSMRRLLDRLHVSEQQLRRLPAPETNADPETDGCTAAAP